MTYQPHDPEFYQFLLDDMPAETLNRWHRQAIAYLREREKREDRENAPEVA